MLRLKCNVKYYNFYLYMNKNIKRQLKFITDATKIHVLRLKISYSLFKHLNCAYNIIYI